MAVAAAGGDEGPWSLRAGPDSVGRGGRIGGAGTGIAVQQRRDGVVMTWYAAPGVLVGVDGSAGSMVAARWAAVAAEQRKVPLRLVRARPQVVAALEGAAFLDVDEQLLEQDREVLAGARGELQESHPRMRISSEVISGDPRMVLVDLSADAVLTVVGTRGRGRIPEVTLGSVALHVAAYGRSPVAVIPTHSQAGSGPVLLGVDASPNSMAAVTAAFEEAALRRTTLDVVFAVPASPWPDRLRSSAEVAELTAPRDHGAAQTGTATVTATTVIPAGEDPAAHAVLSEQLAGHRTDFPDVRVAPHVITGRPADVLVERAGRMAPRPAMIVVGTRGRGGLTGLILGSTGQRLITRATFPVLVVPPG